MNQRNRTFRVVDPALGEAVRTGTAWLDEHFPDWPQRVDLSLLDMMSPHRCVLGQVVDERVAEDGISMSGYTSAMIEHGLIGMDMSTLGFAPSFDSNMPGAQQYTMLRDLWEQVVKGRRAAAAL